MTRIHDLELAGYQHLTGRYAFGPGLNVVTGPNESGKSTLHEALTVALFGFSSEDRRRAAGRSAKDLRRPWTGAPFGGVLTVTDRDGRLARVRWDFDADLVEVTDAATGRTLLSEQPQQRRDFTVGPMLLGLSREDFRQLSCLFQQGLEPVRPSETLRQSLQRAVELTAGPDGGVEGAQQRLKALLSAMGVHGGHFGATQGGRLARTEAAVQDLEQRREQSAQDRLGLEQLACRRVELDTQLAQVDARIMDDEQAVLRADAGRLADEQALAVQLERTLPAAGAEPAPSLPAGLDGRVAAACDDMADAERELAAAEQSAAAAAAELAEAREAARRTESARVALAAYADVDTSHEEAVRAALGRLRSAAPAVDGPAAPSPRDPRVQRFRAERARLETEAAAPAGRPAAGARPVLAPAAALALAGVAGAVAVHPAALVLLGIAMIVAVVALRRRAVPAPATPLVFEGRPLADLARAAEEEDRAWLRHEAALAEHERLVAQSAAVREAAEAALLRLLGASDASGAPLVARAGDYLRQCAKHREHEDADRLAERAATRLRDAGEPAEDVRRAERRLRDATAELRRLVGRAGIEEDDLEVALNTFDALVAAETTRREEAEQRADAAGRLEQLLDGRSVEELAAAAEQAAAELAAHEAAHGHRTGGRVEGAARTEALAMRERLIGELADLRARIDERESRMEDPADLELQLEAARAELGRLHTRRDAARMALDELAAAASEAHRRVAPHLNAALARTLPRLTRDRYREAMVGDDLSIRVVAPETGNVVDVERLSRGTRDQIALVQRLELARLLDPSGGGAPLLLDDCFAHTDEHRLPRALELLAEVAEHRQVVVFTDDRAVVAAAGSMPAASVLELPDPVPSPLPRALALPLPRAA